MEHIKLLSSNSITQLQNVQNELRVIVSMSNHSKMLITEYNTNFLKNVITNSIQQLQLIQKEIS